MKRDLAKLILIEDTTEVTNEKVGESVIGYIVEKEQTTVLESKPSNMGSTFSDEQWENVEPKILEVAEQAFGPAYQHLRDTNAPRATMVYETDTLKVSWQLNGIGDSIAPTSAVFVRSGRDAPWTQLQGAQSFQFSLDINSPLPAVTLTMVPL